MDYFIDWSYRLTVPTNGERLPREAVQAMEFLFERFQISHFCIMPDFDANLESVSLFLLRWDRIANRLRSLLPPHLKIKIVPCVYLTRELSGTEHLNRLLFTKNRYLPLQLPLGEYAEWMDYEIHQLLYRQKYNLLLTSCERYPEWYPPNVTEKLFRIPHAVYQFNYCAFCDEGASQYISQLLERRQTVLLGTGLTSLGKAWQYDFSHYQKTATKKLSVADYQKLMHQNRSFWTLPKR